MRRACAAVAAASLTLFASSPALGARPAVPLAPNDRSPVNMGYCARYLGGGGLGVRPTINKLLVESGSQFGYRNAGDLYSDRARSREDRECLPRTSPPAPSIQPLRRPR